MPTVQEMIYNNMNHIEEKSFVHSTFFYEKDKGSQFIADRLACGLDISCDINVESIEFVSDGFLVNGEKFDKVIFCGNIKQLPILIKNFDIEEFVKPIDSLEYHGTTSVFCEIDKNPYSWIYLPDKKTEAHRIICTGNFSESNNAIGKMTATVEFTDFMDKNDIEAELKKTPLNPKYLDHHYNEYTYPIQDHRTKDLIRSLKMKLQNRGFYFTGRFADWEYYNMDIAMGASMDICKMIE
jgi:protoporphyrinogen oxidase